MDTMDRNLDELLAEIDGEIDGGRDGDLAPPATAQRPPRQLSQLMRKIPVTLTLEVGSARISLQELINIDQDSVIELDTLAGEALVIKVNGTPIGRAEVVVAGENYGLKVVELADLNLAALAS